MNRKSPRRHDFQASQPQYDQLEGRNLVIEALRRGRRRVRKVMLDERARPDAKVAEIERLVAERGVPLERVPRGRLDSMSRTEVHNGVIALADPLPDHTVASLLAEIQAEGRDPFIVLVDEASYEHNLGAILRTALAAGVDGVVIPVVRGKGLTPIVQRVAMGAAEAVPLVREGISSALATLRRAGVRIVGADMDGAPVWDVPLRGSIALVIGGESKGLTAPLRARCDAIAAVPLGERIESLNLSVTAGIMMFEKVRQDRT